MSRDGGNGQGRTRFYRLGGFAYRRRWLLLVVWLVLLVLAFPFVAKLSDRLSQGGFEVPGSQSDRVRQALKEDFHQSDLTDSLVLQSSALSANDPTCATGQCHFAVVFQRIASSIQKPTEDGFQEVLGVANPFDPSSPPGSTAIAQDGHLVTTRVSLGGTQNTALTYAEELQSRVNEVVADDPNFQGSTGAAMLTGAGPFYHEFSQTTTEDLSRAEQIAFPLSMFILLLAFGSLVAAGMPLAMAPSGKAVFVSGLTVVVALAGTQLVNIQAFKSMGFGAMISVAFALAAALTLLPALIGLIGKNIERLRIRRKPASESRLWHRWAMTVMRRPWVFLVSCVAILLLLATPALHMRLGSSGPSILPSDSIPRRAAELVAKPPPQGFG